jgi:hypothetical protein
MVSRAVICQRHWQVLGARCRGLRTCSLHFEQMDFRRRRRRSAGSPTLQNDLRCRLFALYGVCPYGVLCGRLHVSNIPHDPHSIQYRERGPYASSVAYSRQLLRYPLLHVYSKFLPRDNIDSIRLYRQAAVMSLRKVARQLPLIEHHTSRSNIAICLYNLQYIEEVFNIIDIMQYSTVKSAIASAL